MKLQTVQEINKFFEEWHDLSELERIKAIKSLKEQGSLAFVGGQRPQKFKCPIHQFKVAMPCGLKSCHYYIEHTESKNCVINCLESAKNHRLLSQEIAALIDSPVNAVNQTVDAATRKIQIALIRDQVDHYAVPRFKFLPNHCVSCGMHIEDELAMNPESCIESEFGWCSSECKTKTPAWAFRLEKHFECDAVDVLAVSYAVVKKPESVDSLLKLSNGTCKQFIGQIRERLSGFA